MEVVMNPAGSYDDLKLELPRAGMIFQDIRGGSTFLWIKYVDVHTQSFLSDHIGIDTYQGFTDFYREAKAAEWKYFPLFVDTNSLANKAQYKRRNQSKQCDFTRMNEKRSSSQLGCLDNKVTSRSDCLVEVYTINIFTSRAKGQSIRVGITIGKRRDYVEARLEIGYFERKIGTMGFFHMKLSKTFIRELESLIVDFSGIKRAYTSLEAFNNALLAKQAWSIIHQLSILSCIANLTVYPVSSVKVGNRWRVLDDNGSISALIDHTHHGWKDDLPSNDAISNWGLQFTSNYRHALDRTVHMCFLDRTNNFETHRDTHKLLVLGFLSIPFLLALSNCCSGVELSIPESLEFQGANFPDVEDAMHGQGNYTTQVGRGPYAPPPAFQQHPAAPPPPPPTSHHGPPVPQPQVIQQGRPSFHFTPSILPYQQAMPGVPHQVPSAPLVSSGMSSAQSYLTHSQHPQAHVSTQNSHSHPTSEQTLQPWSQNVRQLPPTAPIRGPSAYPLTSSQGRALERGPPNQPASHAPPPQLPPYSSSSSFLMSDPFESSVLTMRQHCHLQPTGPLPPPPPPPLPPPPSSPPGVPPHPPSSPPSDVLSKNGGSCSLKEEPLDGDNSMLECLAPVKPVEDRSVPQIEVLCQHTEKNGNKVELADADVTHSPADSDMDME
ncbi:UNVERIFIED_CONTAM: hypothetical protein Sindi_0420400, partial [Sesamum indicum]